MKGTGAAGPEHHTAQDYGQSARLFGLPGILSRRFERPVLTHTSEPSAGMIRHSCQLVRIQRPQTAGRAHSATHSDAAAHISSCANRSS